MPKHRSAKTGRAVSAKEAKANPDTTVHHSKSKDTLRLDWLLANQRLLSITGSFADKEVWIYGAGRLSRKEIDKAMKANA